MFMHRSWTSDPDDNLIGTGFAVRLWTGNGP
jgi:hypothetical protein